MISKCQPIFFQEPHSMYRLPVMTHGPPFLILDLFLSHTRAPSPPNSAYRMNLQQARFAQSSSFSRASVGIAWAVFFAKSNFANGAVSSQDSTVDHVAPLSQVVKREYNTISVGRHYCIVRPAEIRVRRA